MTHAIEPDLAKVELSSTDERARAAVKAFRAMQPGLTGMARALSRNSKVQVVMSSTSNGHTDGTKIFYRPPIALGDRTRHDRSLCDRRDDNEQLLCPACSVREDVLGTIYHELAHIIFDTYGAVSDEDRVEAISRAIREHGSKYAKKLEAAIRGRYGNDYINMSNLISPYMGIMFNALEDARIERQQANARPGTRVMFRSKIRKIAIEGVETQDFVTGEVKYIPWSERPLNTQIVVGLYVKAAGYHYADMFHADVIDVLNDEQVSKICGRVENARSNADINKLTFPLLARIRELGYLKSDKEPEEVQDEPEEAADEQDSSGSGDNQQDSDGESNLESDETSPGSSDRIDSPDSSEHSDETQDSSGSDDSDDAADADSSGTRSDSEATQEPSGSDQSGDETTEEVDDANEGNTSSEDGTSQGESENGDAPDAQPECGTDPGEQSPAGEGKAKSDLDPGESESSPGGPVGEGSPGGSEGRSGQSQSLDSVDEDSEGSTDGAQSDARMGQADALGDDDRDPDNRDERSSVPEQSEGNTSSDAHSPVVDQGGDLDGERTEGSLDNVPDELQSGQSDLERADGDNQNDRQSEGSKLEGSSDDNADLDGTRESREKRDVEIDTGADQGKGGVSVEQSKPERPEMGDESDAEAALIKWLDHEDPPRNLETKQNESAIDKAIIQGLYFETPSVNVYGVTEHRWSDEGADELRCWNKTRTTSGYSRKSEAGSDFETPESLLGPALLQMRRTFEDNARARFERHRKSGKVNGHVLGKRAPLGDDRLFQQKRLSGKKSYHVIIMMDISYSTVGVNIGIMKHAVIAQTHLLDRMGIPFSIYAHTSGRDHNIGDSEDDYFSTMMQVYCIREPGEPWDSSMMERIEALGPGMGNLDGHAMEYMRKHLDAVKATHKVGLYYSDGKMPAENFDEELEILQREIAVIRKKRYALLGVGIRTDSPTQHGLETVQLDSVADTGKVIAQLRTKLLEIS